jgi:hypothetical protein
VNRMSKKAFSRVKSFNISGLKAIKSVNVELTSLNYLVGKNSVGKSSLIQGVLCLADNLRNNRPDNLQLNGSGYNFESTNAATNRNYSGFSLGIRAEILKTYGEILETRETVESEVSMRRRVNGTGQGVYSSLGFESGSKQVTSDFGGFLERVRSKGFSRNLPSFSTWKLSRPFANNPFGVVKVDGKNAIHSLKSSVIDPISLAKSLEQAISRLQNHNLGAVESDSKMEFQIDGSDLLAFAAEKIDWNFDVESQFQELLNNLDVLIPEYWQLEVLANDNLGLFSSKFSGALYDHFFQGEENYDMESGLLEPGLTPHEYLVSTSMISPTTIFLLGDCSGILEMCDNFVSKVSTMNPSRLLKQAGEIDSEWSDFNENMESLAEFVGQSIHYLGPLRSSGLEMQQDANSSNPLVPVGLKGEFFVSALLHRLDGVNRRKRWNTQKDQKSIDLSDVVFDDKTPVEKLQSFTRESSSYSFGSRDQFVFELDHLSGMSLLEVPNFIKRRGRMQNKNSADSSKFVAQDEENEILYPMPAGGESPDLQAVFMSWLEYLEISDSLEFVNKGHLGIQVKVGKDLLHHVGTGVSQVLPVLTICLLAKPGSLTFIEQPELHLHPAAQQKLADFFLAIGKSGRQLFVETHSEYFIHRARRSVALKQAKSSDIQILFAEQGDGGSIFRRAKIRNTGSTTYWPQGFLAESENDIYDIISANLA